MRSALLLGRIALLLALRRALARTRRFAANNGTGRLNRFLNMRRGELPLALVSALFFFLVLCGYFFLRPVREAMGVARGMDELRWLFVATSVAALAAVLAFGGVVARMNRRRFIPAVYLFVVACLVGFAALLIQDVRAGGGLIGTGAQTGLSRGVGYTFYIWLTVVNLLSGANRVSGFCST